MESGCVLKFALPSGQFIRVDMSDVIEMVPAFSEYRFIARNIVTKHLSHVTIAGTDVTPLHKTLDLPVAVCDDTELTLYALKTFPTGDNVTMDVLASGRIYIIQDDEQRRKYTLKLRHHEKSRSIVKDLKRRRSSTNDLFPIRVKHQPPSWHVISNESNDVDEDYDAFLVIRDNDSGNECFIISEKETREIHIPFPLSSVKSYTVQLFLMTDYYQEDDVFHSYDVKAASEIIPFLSYMTLDDLQLLKSKAERFLVDDSDWMAPISHFYRNKPHSYYNQISRKGGFMRTYRKVHNGDEASSINGNISGLYFSAYVERNTLAPPTFSYFGCKRLNVPAIAMLGRGKRLYFADFYCHYKKHHVTLVLTENGSWTDRECENRLLELNIWNNPFLQLRMNRDLTEWSALVRAFTSLSVVVEVLYTEDINIRELFSKYPTHAYFTTVETRGPCISNLHGRPKNAKCKVCSVKPDEFYTPQQENNKQDDCLYQDFNYSMRQ